MTEKQHIVFDHAGAVGRVRLCRPEALNSLTPEMCAALHTQLRRWAIDDSMAAVVVTADGGRAFCAGGDVRHVYDTGREDPVAARSFFQIEYPMNAAIVDFPKPYVCLIDGIVMGGGLGISVHGSFRVMSEHAMAAMPETGIGLLPDVGATAFLNACPGRIGLYLGLTGTRLHAADAIHAGIGTHFVPRERQAALLDALAGAEYLGDAFAVVEGIVSRFAGDPGESVLRSQQQEIDRLFADDTVEEIVETLKTEGSAFSDSCLETLSRMSPTSLKITARQISDNAGISPKEALILEYRLVSRVLEGHDFYEGIRAALIDKDRNPAWKPAHLDMVSDADIDTYFAPLGAAELRLP